MGWEDYWDVGREDERDGMLTRIMHRAMNGMGRIWMGKDECDGATMNGMGRLRGRRMEDEKDGMSTRTMHEAVNGMGILRGRRMGG